MLSIVDNQLIADGNIFLAVERGVLDDAVTVESLLTEGQAYLAVPLGHAGQGFHARHDIGSQGVQLAVEQVLRVYG